MLSLLIGDKFIYDTYTDYFREITYDRFSITEEQWKNEFKERLKSMMERKQINQEGLAIALGSSQQMISRYCTGSAMPSNYMIHKIAIALGCRDEDLIYHEY